MIKPLAINSPYQLIHQFLENQAVRQPEKVALVHEEVRATYAEVNRLANCVAAWFKSTGVVAGDRVVLLLPNSLEYVAAYYGILKVGAVAVPLSTDLKPDGLADFFKRLGAAAIVAGFRSEKSLGELPLKALGVRSQLLYNPKMAWKTVGFETAAWETVAAGDDPGDPPSSAAPHDLASIIFTSGSTGTPKGVMLSHANIVANTFSICQSLRLDRNDIQMVVLPFFYVMGKSLLNTHFAVGGSIVINNKFAFPASVVKQMSDEKVTGFSGVPSTFAYLLHRSPLKTYQNKLGSLRFCAQAGGHMPRQLKVELRQALPPHTDIYIMYGATEASARLSCLAPERFADKLDSIGKPIAGVSMRVRNKSGREVPPGEIGELVGSGPNIMMGYWNDPEGTRKVLDSNGYHTGDMGYQDEEGYIFLTGRKDNLLKVGGHRINPQEVEDALMTTRLLMEVAVVGIPDDLLGNRLVAIAAPIENDCNENQILSDCAQLLPKYKLPSEIKLVGTLPKNANGKIDRTRCLELVLKNAI